jgi:HNH endonuclease
LNLCLCGCGTEIPTLTKQGYPQKYKHGHNTPEAFERQKFKKGHKPTFVWPKGEMLREKNPSWKGGRFIQQGYVMIYIPDHPNAGPNGYVKEHRYIMSNILGRPLLPTELIHHKDGNKLNNNPENLEKYNRSGHGKLHATLNDNRIGKNLCLNLTS